MNTIECSYRAESGPAACDYWKDVPHRLWPVSACGVPPWNVYNTSPKLAGSEGYTEIPSKCRIVWIWSALLDHNTPSRKSKLDFTWTAIGDDNVKIVPAWSTIAGRALTCTLEDECGLSQEVPWEIAHIHEC